MRCMRGAAVMAVLALAGGAVVTTASTATAGHYSFHGRGVGGFGVGFGGSRYCGPLGYGYRSFGIGIGGPYGGFAFGSPVFAAARANLYGTYYSSYGFSPFTYYAGPAPTYYAPAQSYIFGAPGLYTPPPAPILYGPTAVPPVVNNGPLLPQQQPAAQPQVIDNDLAKALDPSLLEPAEPVEGAVRVSNAEARRKSARIQGFGDEWFVKREFGQALQRYRDAITLTPDLYLPRLKLGVTYCALHHPELAAREFKRSLKLDPSWPITAPRLEDMFGGAPGDVARNHLLLEVGDWVRQDIRDPERLFVLGTLLFLDDNRDQAMPFLKTAAQLSGSVAYLDPFVMKAQVVEPAGAEQPAVEPAPRRPQIVRPRQPARPEADVEVPQGAQVVDFPTLKAPAADTSVSETPSVDAPALPDLPADIAEEETPTAPIGGQVGPLLPDGTFGTP